MNKCTAECCDIYDFDISAQFLKVLLNSFTSFHIHVELICSGDLTDKNDSHL